MLIREGSQEWRKLCDVDDYKERFPDGHFDLDTKLVLSNLSYQSETR